MKKTRLAYNPWVLLRKSGIYLDPFVIYSLYIVMWFKSLRPFSCLLRPFSCSLRPFPCLHRPFSCLQISEYFDWLKYRLIGSLTLIK